MRIRLVLGLLIAGLQAESQTPAPKQPQEKRLLDSLEGGPLYAEYCAVCHGKAAKGGGPMGRALKIAPPDLTRIAARNGGAFPFQRVQRIISGESEMDSHGTREMPLWGSVFSQVDRDQDLGRVRIYNLAKYLETLQTR